MKRLAALVLAASFLLVRPAYASSSVELDAITTDTDSNAVVVSAKKKIRVRIYSAAGSTSAVLVQARVHGSSTPWITLKEFDDVDATGVYWNVPRIEEFRFSATVASGTVTAILETYND